MAYCSNGGKMKKNNHVRFSTSIAVLCFLTAVAMSSSGGMFVKKLTGKVTVNRGTKSFDAHLNDALKEKDVVSIGLKGQADIQLGGKVAVRLLELTNFTIKESKKNKSTINFTTGNILVKVKKLAKNEQLNIETPLALAGVRGTQFWGQVRKDGEIPASTFAVREGTLMLKPKGYHKFIEVSVGNALDMAEGQKEYKIRKAKPEEMGAMQQIDEIDF